MNEDTASSGSIEDRVEELERQVLFEQRMRRVEWYEGLSVGMLIGLVIGAFITWLKY